MAREALASEAPTSTDCPNLFPEYADDPIGFIRDKLRVNVKGEKLPLRPWGQQREIALSVASHRRTAVKSGHKIGKSNIAVTIALWWAMTRPSGLVIMTSAGANQVSKTLWAELTSIYRASGGDAAFHPAHDLALQPQTGLRLSDKRAIYGFTAKDAEAMQGFSGDQLLFIVDEASGFSDALYEAVTGNMMGGGCILATGNPTRTTGWFFDAFHGKRDLWSTFTVDSRTTPNCTGDSEPIAGLADPELIETYVQEYGQGDRERAEQNPTFQVRVMGRFPDQASNSVIGLGVIEAAKERHRAMEEPPPGRLQIGVDPAYYGDDDTSITPRRGTWMGETEDHNGLGPDKQTEKVLQVVRRYRHGGDWMERPLVVVDDTGGYGAGLLDRLRNDHADEVDAVGVNSSTASTITDSLGNLQYANTRAELWFSLSEWCATGAVPPDAKAEAEMLAPTFDLDAKGRRRVEPKDKIKERLGRSPDRADSRALAVYRPPGMGVSPIAPPPPPKDPSTRGRYQFSGRGTGSWRGW